MSIDPKIPGNLRGAGAPDGGEASIQEGPGHALRSRPLIREADALIRALDAWTLERQMEITAIPAPPFGEGPRGVRMAEIFREVGLESVRIDREGNVLGEIPESERENGPQGKSLHGQARPDRLSSGDAMACLPESRPLILSAHLDTVFPEGTDTTPVRDGDLIRAPGITDDGRGLAVLLTLARVLLELPLPLSLPLLFAASVGEEGVGNLRGVRHLFREGSPARRALGFISLDGVGLDRIITGGVGSTRLRIEAAGPGGHSWSDWGAPNPIHALARLVAGAQELLREEKARSTLTVARWGGGSSINAIPRTAWIEVDLRSEHPEALTSLEEGLRSLARKAAFPGEGTPPGAQTTPRALEVEILELGRRPAGSTPAGCSLVAAAVGATRALGKDPVLLSSSTDANLPMSLGIPAITLGAGGSAGGIHTPDEWYRNDEGPEGILRALLTLVLLAGSGSGP